MGSPATGSFSLVRVLEDLPFDRKQAVLDGLRRKQITTLEEVSAQNLDAWVSFAEGMVQNYLTRPDSSLSDATVPPDTNDVLDDSSEINPAPPPLAQAEASALASSYVERLASASAAKTGLRELVANVPAQFRCALDGKLLADPVRSPQGLVFERSTLQRWLAENGKVCPRTGMPLRFEEFSRAGDIRRELVNWARETLPTHK